VEGLRCAVFLGSNRFLVVVVFAFAVRQDVKYSFSRGSIPSVQVLMEVGYLGPSLVGTWSLERLHLDDILKNRRAGQQSTGLAVLEVLGFGMGV
jgi:hypothetical protein